jgi:hypothetical protein
MTIEMVEQSMVTLHVTSKSQGLVELSQSFMLNVVCLLFRNCGMFMFMQVWCVRFFVMSYYFLDRNAIDFS